MVMRAQSALKAAQVIFWSPCWLLIRHPYVKKKERKEAEECQLTKEAAVEFMKLERGNENKEKANADLQEKLGKACKCALIKAQGYHKDMRNVHPQRMKEILLRHERDRSQISNQLCERTSLTPSQRKAALDHLFGPEGAPVASSSISCSKGKA